MACSDAVTDSIGGHPQGRYRGKCDIVRPLEATGYHVLIWHCTWGHHGSSDLIRLLQGYKINTIIVYKTSRDNQQGVVGNRNMVRICTRTSEVPSGYFKIMKVKVEEKQTSGGEGLNPSRITLQC